MQKILSYIQKDLLHVVLKGESGVGKSYLAQGVLEAFLEEDVVKVSRVTPAWLDHVKDELKHKILFIHQIGGAE